MRSPIDEPYTLTARTLCAELWKDHANRQAGFAVNLDSWEKLPPYLVERVRAQYSSQTGPQVHPSLRSFVLFTFPEEFGSVLDDLVRQELGSSCLVWDRSGQSIKPKVSLGQ